VAPLVSVITPTWNRHDLLLDRCIPSVATQNYRGEIEHIVVSDGPDDGLYNALCALAPPGVRYAELPAHDPDARWGHWARLAGIDLATGEIIAYLDDDNAYRPDHIAVMVDALENVPVAGFAYPRTLMHVHGNEFEIGSDPPAYGQIDTSGIVHRRELLSVAIWQPSLPSIDWDLVQRWMLAGVKWAYVPRVTVDYHK
jgi:glycosyltransferase involved in cell wall biosynthesis